MSNDGTFLNLIAKTTFDMVWIHLEQNLKKITKKLKL